jgi:zinc and cadmium transporter
MLSAFYPIVATFIVSLTSLVGVVFLAFKKNFLEKTILIFIAFAAGAMIGSAFFDLIPESMAIMPTEEIFIYLLIGFSAFFLMEKVLYWRHCHELGGECKEHPFTYLNLIGNGFHNFLDGAVIAASFAMDYKLGITTTIAVFLHELPHEIGDFSVLLYGGMNKIKAIALNFLSGLMAVVGVFVYSFFAGNLQGITGFLIAFAAGGFLYISASDLVPQLHEHKGAKMSILSYLFFVFGIVFIYFAGIYLQ